MLHRTLLVFVALLAALCNAELLTSGEDVASFVTRSIDTNEVMVFAKSYCPYCKATRSLLETMQLTIDCQVDVLDLDKLDAEDGALIQLELLRRTGQRTVPNVFIQGSHIGGNSDMQEQASTGELERRLERAVATRSVQPQYLRKREELQEPPL